MSAPRVLLSAGEVSGDVVGAELVSRLRDLCPEVVTFGLGGARMRAAGCLIECDTNLLGTVGVTEALRTGPSFARAFLQIRRVVLAAPPDVAVLIGNDIFNVAFARWLRRRGIQTIAYFPPQVWVWRVLARPIARSFGAILASFPDEQRVYADAAGHEVAFVGHYLAERLEAVTPAARAAARGRLGLSTDAPVVVLMPGSRRAELQRIGPVLLDAAVDLVRGHPGMQLLMPLAESAHRVHMEAEIARRPLDSVIRLCEDSRDAMRAADIAVMASGTASLEAALLGTPSLLVYKLSALSVAVIRAFIRLGVLPATTALPNLILRRNVVPELLWEGLTPRAVVSNVVEALADSSRFERTAEVSAEVRRRISMHDCLGQVGGTILSVARARMVESRPVTTRLYSDTGAISR